MTWRADDPGTPRLVRPAATGVVPLRLDADQRRVVAHGRGDGPLVVRGAPGTGRTTALVESVAARVERDAADPARVLVLAPTRRAAAQLRDRVSARLARTVAEPGVRTPHAYAFSLLRRLALAAGEPPPRLLAGPEQDRVLADLLAGHAAGEGRPVAWPPSVPAETRGLRGFRDELRDLLMRALERGLAPADLRAAGRRHGRPEWVAGAAVLGEYLEVTALATPNGYDPAGIVDQAGQRLADDEDLLATEVRRWQLVAVDDHHESTEATARLLDLLVGGGGDLLVTGDPDATTQSFRGGDPRLVAAAEHRYRRADGAPAEVVVLRTPHRQAAEPVDLVALFRRVSERIGSAGSVAHRAAVPATPPAGSATRPSPLPSPLPSFLAASSVEAHVLRSATQEGAFVAHLLRSEHLLGGRPWSTMAVVVRSAGRTAALRRAFAATGVPVASPAAEVPVRDEPAVRPLRTALRLVLRPDGAEPQDAVALLTSPLGGTDALGLRRLRRRLLAEERAGGGSRASDDLLVEALADPVRTATLDRRVAAPAARVARVLAAGRHAAAEPGATAETVLWALWQATGLAGAWRQQALVGGPAGSRADRDLDAVLALFDAAARFVDRLPGQRPEAFLDHLDAQDVPADTLAEHAPDDDAVQLLTAAGSAGREWDVVVVAGLQDGVWPDTRLRGSLLGSTDLVDVLAGRGDDPAGARRQVLDDELRLLHVAVSRARQRVVATAVRDADERPSPFLDLVAPYRPAPGNTAAGGAGSESSSGSGSEERPETVVPRAVTLPALVAELRQVLLVADGERDGSGRAVDPGRRRTAAAALARLAAAGVPGAGPSQWYALAPLSDDGPLRAEGEPVHVSPSRVEAFHRCGLRWLLETNGGATSSGTSQGVGTLVHDVAAEHPDADADTLLAEVDRRWPSLGLGDGWVSARERGRAHAMVRRLAGYTAGSDREVAGTEVEVSTPVGRAVVRGRVDRLERDAEGRLVVVDLKTGSSAPKDGDVARHAQLGVYQVVVAEGGLGPGATSGGAALVQLGGTRKAAKEQRQRALADDADPGWARQVLDTAADGMAADRFAAVGNDLCRRCPVRAACPLQPEGRQVTS